MAALAFYWLLLTPTTWAVNNGLARTPPMGWNNWNSLGCDVSQSLLLDTATNLVELGLRDVGYEYVVLDDCWSDGRDQQGKLKVDLHRFPAGMNFVSDSVHKHGLKFGMYSSAGHLTCARYEGSLDHEIDDAQSFAGWGVDYFKYDNCYSLGRIGAEPSFKRYNDMAMALNATGRPIVYSLCNWGEDFVSSWGASIANSWRVSGDIYDSFSRPDDLCSCTNQDPSAPFCVAPGSQCSVLTILNRVAPYADRGQFGAWQDLDMLEVGNGGMTVQEQFAHQAMWAALKSPLLIGADIRDLDAEALSILNNPAIIALSQDPLGRPVRRVIHNPNHAKDKWGVGETHVWSGPLYGGDQVVIALNAVPDDLRFNLQLEDIFVHDGPGGKAPGCKQVWDVYDLWEARMPVATARRIVNAAKDPKKGTGETAETIEKIYQEIDWFNSTETSYREALDREDTRLFGKKVDSWRQGKPLILSVPKHSARVLRLRNLDRTAVLKKYGTQKDEL